MVVDKNEIRNPVDGGIDISGVGVAVSRNRLRTGGGNTSDESIDVVGTDHRIEGNSVSDWKGKLTRRNRVRDCKNEFRKMKAY
jgi:hypothetical protein